MARSSIPHQSQKVLEADFSSLWDRLNRAANILLVTPVGHKFNADAIIGVRGTHEHQKLVRITQKGKEFARIYQCCWGHTTNCYGTRIGGYRDGLNSWYKGLMISLDSLTLKPKNEVIKDFGTLLNSPPQIYRQALLNTRNEPGVYLVYDNKQRKYLYVDTKSDIRKRLQQHLRSQGAKSKFHAQQIQKGLIDNQRCSNSSDANKYMATNCTVRILNIADEKTRKYSAIRRFLLQHYAMAVLEPDYNIMAESQ